MTDNIDISIQLMALDVAAELPPPPLVMDGRVHLQGSKQSGAPHEVKDRHVVALGGHSPRFRPRKTEDRGRVRIGGHSPVFVYR